MFKKYKALHAEVWAQIWREIWPDVRVDSVPRAIGTIVGPLAGIALTYYLSHSWSYTGIAALAIFLVLLFCLFFIKLYSVPFRMLAAARSAAAAAAAERAAAPAPGREHDAALFRRFGALITRNDIQFLRQHDFSNTYRVQQVQNLMDLTSWNVAADRFVNEGLGQAFESLKMDNIEFIRTLGTFAMPSRHAIGLYTVLTDEDQRMGEISLPTRMQIRELNQRADRLANDIDEFVQQALRAGLTLE